MPGDAETGAAVQSPAQPVPTGLEAAREVSQQIMERNLPPEQAQVLRKARAEKKAKIAEATKSEMKPEPQAEVKTELKAEIKPEPKPEAEVFTFGEEPEKTVESEPEETLPEAEDLTEDELAKLSEKARKQYLDAHKQAAAVRKRAQEAEAALKDKDTALAEREEKLTAAQQQLQQILERGPALAANEFGQFTDANQVADWHNNALEAVTLLTAHERAVKAGRADAEDTVTHVLPNGDEVQLSLKSKAGFEQRLADAKAWFDTTAKLKQNSETAKQIEARHQSWKGYKDALDKIAADPDLHTRLPELQRKAAAYDTLMARKAMITFPDTAAAATKADSDKTTRSPDKDVRKPAPLTDKAASAPRMVEQRGDDVSTRRSELMELAMTAKDDATRQKYLKQAMMLPNPNRTIAVPGKRQAA